jgi:putative ABC transport system permease protein
MILLGLKHGMIHAMLDNLKNDPVHREIRPEGLLPFVANEGWFKTIRSRTDVAFVIPSLRGLGQTLTVRNLHNKAHCEAESRPTSNGDPLFEDANVYRMTYSDAVISPALANKLGLRLGDQLDVSVFRLVGGKREEVTAPFTICGVSSERVTDKDTVWLSLEFLADVEAYLAGGAVPRLKWAGAVAALQPRYDGVLVTSMDKIPPEKIDRIMTLSGFGTMENWNFETFHSRTGLDTRAAHSSLWRAIGNTVDESNIAKLESMIAEIGIEATLIPWVDDLHLTLIEPAPEGDLQSLPPLLAIDQVNFGKLASMAPPASTGSRGRTTDSPALSREGYLKSDQASQDLAWEIVVHPDAALARHHSIKVALASGDGDEIRIPLTVRTEQWVPKKIAAVSAALTGRMREASRRSVSFDEETREFIFVRKGYRDFRLYAKDIDAVGMIVNFFEEQGIRVRSNRQAISRVRLMEGYLQKLYGLIASVSGVAAFFVLLVSLFANVRRKAAALSCLQLVGLDHSRLFFFPVYQSIVLLAASFVVALLAYECFVWAAETFVASEFTTHGAICLLTGEHLGMLFTISFFVAAISASLAAIGILRLDPAEHLRPD